MFQLLTQEYQMENNCRSYQLAHSYDNYASKRHFLRQHHLSSLPFSIQQEQGSHPTVSDTPTHNIFRCSIPPPPAPSSEALQKTPYHAVGVKEVKAYISKADKRRRHMNSWVKRSTQSALSMSRCSQMKVPQERYMTKEEVLSTCKVSNTSPSQLNETYLLDTKLHSQLTSMNNTLQTLTHHKSHSHQFSMKKVMARMRSYKKGWEKQTAQRQIMVKKEPKRHGKLKSILQDAEAYRDRIEEQENQLVSQQMENVQPKLWGLVLRSSKTMAELRECKKEHLVREGLITAGSSKWRKEVSWLEEKDKQGHFFKLHKQAQLSTRG